MPNALLPPDAPPLATVGSCPCTMYSSQKQDGRHVDTMLMLQTKLRPYMLPMFPCVVYYVPKERPYIIQRLGNALFTNAECNQRTWLSAVLHHRSIINALLVYARDGPPFGSFSRFSGCIGYLAVLPVVTAVHICTAHRQGRLGPLVASADSKDHSRSVVSWA